MAEIKWIKVMTDVFEHRKIRQIECLPEADAILVIWFKLLCLAGMLNSDGTLYFTEGISYNPDMLAIELKRPLATINKALQVFLQFNMITENQGVYRIVNWDKYQNIEGLDRIREQTRTRVQRYRENQKQPKEAVTLRNATETLHETLRNAPDKNRIEENRIEREENISSIPTLPSDEPEKPKPTKKPRKKKPSVEYDLTIIQDEQLLEAMTGFIEFRGKIKKPMTQRAVELAISKLNDLSPDIDTQIKIIQQSIFRGWSGLFKLSEDYQQQRQPAKKSELKRLMDL